MKTEPALSVPGLISFLLLLLVAAAMCTSVIADDDVFWHLSSGRWMWEHKAVFDTDVLSYPTAGATLLPTEWGWEILTYGIVTVTGTLASLQILTALIWIAIFTLLFNTMRRFCISPTVSVLFLLVTALVSVDRMTPRPHLVSLLGMTIVLTWYFHVRYFSNGGVRPLFVLPALFVLWANMHPGVLGGLFLLTVLFVSEIVRKWQIFSGGEDAREATLSQPSSQPTSKPSLQLSVRPLLQNELGQFLLLWISCIAAVCVNPNGWKTWEFLFTHANLRILSTVLEWQSPFSPAISSGFIWIYRSALILYAVAVYFSFRKKDPLPAVLYIAFALYSLRAVRFQADFAIAALIGTACAVQFLIDSGPVNLRRFVTGKTGSAAMIAICALVIFGIPGGSFYKFMKYHNHFGTGVDEDFFSGGLMKFMKEERISGRPLNDFTIGGWLSWEIPGEQSFIDSRDTDERVADTYDSLMAMKPGFEKILERYGVNYIVLQLPELRMNPAIMQSSIIPYCSAHKELWKLVYWDDYSFLYLRNLPKFETTISSKEFRILDPYLYSAKHAAFDSLKTADEGRFGVELRRKAAEEPKGVLVNFLVRYAMQSRRNR